MMRRGLIFAFILNIMMLTSGVLHAGSISMVSKTRVTSGRGWIEVKIIISNRGNEDALVVFPSLRLGEVEVQLKQVPYIAFGGSSSWVHRFNVKRLSFKQSGVYPLFLMTNYHDANMYPFSMPKILLLHYRFKPSDPPLKGIFDVGKVNHTGKAEIMLTNPSQYDLSGTVELFLPNELVSLTPKTQFHLPEGKNIRIPFRFENAGALPGSSYRVYAVAQLVHSAIHYSLVIPEIIKVVGYRSTGNTSLRIAGAIVFLIILFAATVYFEVRKVGKENEFEQCLPR